MQFTSQKEITAKEIWAEAICELAQEMKIFEVGSTTEVYEWAENQFFDMLPSIEQVRQHWLANNPNDRPGKNISFYMP